MICRYFVEKPFVVKSGNFGSEQAFVGRYGMFLRESTVWSGDRFAALFLSEGTVKVVIRGPLRRVSFAGYSSLSVTKARSLAAATGGLAFLLVSTVFVVAVSVAVAGVLQ